MIVSLEVRSRLAVATLTVKGLACRAGDLEVKLNDSGTRVSLVNDGVLELEVEWPNLDDQLMSAETVGLRVTSVQCYGDDIVVRLSLGRRGQVDLLARQMMDWTIDGKRQTGSVHVPRPKCLLHTGSNNKEVIMVCAFCKACLADTAFSTERILPLPSTSWKELSADWFCGCGGHGSGPKKPKGGEEANRQLALKRLEPREGDLLYAPGFLCLNSRSLIASPVERGRLAKCSSCKKVLGESEGPVTKLWQHCILVGPEAFVNTTKPCSVADTFADIVDGFVRNFFGKSAKLLLRCEEESLLIWILDQRLKFFVHDGTLPKSKVVLLEPRTMTKVMWQANPQGPVDQTTMTVDVSADIVNSGLDLVKVGQKYDCQSLATSSMTGGFHTSYIELVHG